MADEDETSIQSVSPEELRVAFSGPAPNSNKFYVNILAAGVRIAFTELRPPEVALPVFRNAVLLSFQDAIQLHHLLRRMLAPIEASIEEAQREGSKDADISGESPNG